MNRLDLQKNVWQDCMHVHLLGWTEGQWTTVWSGRNVYKTVILKWILWLLKFPSVPSQTTSTSQTSFCLAVPQSQWYFRCVCTRLVANSFIWHCGVLYSKQQMFCGMVQLPRVFVKVVLCMWFLLSNTHVSVQLIDYLKINLWEKARALNNYGNTSL